MNSPIACLFKPIRIGKIRIKNRIAMAPMGLSGPMVHPDGVISQRAVNYYLERARGGVGLIISSYFKVENDIEVFDGRHPRITPAALAPLAELCDGVHSFDSRIFIQLSAGAGRVLYPDMQIHAPVSASAVPTFWDPGKYCRPLETIEIENMIKAFGSAAEIVAAAGADGIELHGHEGFLFDQFATELWNRRTDRYGGDLAGRLRFATEVLAEIKRRLGADFPVQYRYGLKHYIKNNHAGALPGEDFQESGRDVEEGLEMARRLEEAGFDALHVDAGAHESWYWPQPPVYQERGCMREMAAQVKTVVNIPVVAVGRLDLPSLAAETVKKGKADIIALGRGLLADPFWPAKLKLGKGEDIRPCIGCYDGCTVRWYQGKGFSCTVNAACGREASYALQPASKPRQIHVVGGGPAGMEAARVAALRGHRVHLYEKDAQIGGQLQTAARLEFKQDLNRLLKWYRRQLALLKVTVHTHCPIHADFIKSLDPKAVVIAATGSRPKMPLLPTNAEVDIRSFSQVLQSPAFSGKRILVLGSGIAACEAALWLVQHGNHVTVVTAASAVIEKKLSAVPIMSRMMLLDKLSMHGVVLMPCSRVQEIVPGRIQLRRQEGQLVDIKADMVVSAMGFKAQRALFDEVEDIGMEIYRIGDCRSPRGFLNAIWDAYAIGRTL